MVDEARPSAASDVSFRSGVGFDVHPLVEGKIPAFRPGHLRLTCGRAHGHVAACAATEPSRCRSLIGDSMAPGRSVPISIPYPLSTDLIATSSALPPGHSWPYNQVRLSAQAVTLIAVRASVIR